MAAVRALLSVTVMERIAKASPRRWARIAGAFYLLNFVTGVLSAAFIGGKFAVYGDAASLIAAGCYVVVTVLFYYMFKPVGRSLSLLAALFSLAGCVLGALGVFHLSPVPINNLVFFGFYCLLIGYLIFRSTFLPRILGALMIFAGLGWLTFVSPPLAGHLAPYNLIPGLVGEGLLTLWLLAMGVNAQRWREQAGEAGSRTHGSPISPEAVAP
jgi:uncharacterized protein DUF4386